MQDLLKTLTNPQLQPAEEVITRTNTITTNNMLSEVDQLKSLMQDESSAYKARIFLLPFLTTYNRLPESAAMQIVTTEDDFDVIRILNNPYFRTYLNTFFKTTGLKGSNRVSTLIIDYVMRNDNMIPGSDADNINEHYQNPSKEVISKTTTTTSNNLSSGIDQLKSLMQDESFAYELREFLLQFLRMYNAMQKSAATQIVTTEDDFDVNRILNNPSFRTFWNTFSSTTNLSGGSRAATLITDYIRHNDNVVQKSDQENAVEVTVNGHARNPAEEVITKTTTTTSNNLSSEIDQLKSLMQDESFASELRQYLLQFLRMYNAMQKSAATQIVTTEDNFDVNRILNNPSFRTFLSTFFSTTNLSGSSRVATLISDFIRHNDNVVQESDQENAVEVTVNGHARNTAEEVITKTTATTSNNLWSEIDQLQSLMQDESFENELREYLLLFLRVYNAMQRSAATQIVTTEDNFDVNRILSNPSFRTFLISTTNISGGSRLATLITDYIKRYDNVMSGSDAENINGRYQNPAKEVITKTTTATSNNLSSEIDQLKSLMQDESFANELREFLLQFLRMYNAMQKSAATQIVTTEDDIDVIRILNNPSFRTFLSTFLSTTNLSGGSRLATLITDYIRRTDNVIQRSDVENNNEHYQDSAEEVITKTTTTTSNNVLSEIDQFNSLMQDKSFAIELREFLLQFINMYNAMQRSAATQIVTTEDDFDVNRILNNPSFRTFWNTFSSNTNLSGGSRLATLITDYIRRNDNVIQRSDVENINEHYQDSAEEVITKTTTTTSNSLSSEIDQLKSLMQDKSFAIELRVFLLQFINMYNAMQKSAATQIVITEDDFDVNRILNNPSFRVFLNNFFISTNLSGGSTVATLITDYIRRKDNVIRGSDAENINEHYQNVPSISSSEKLLNELKAHAPVGATTTTVPQNRDSDNIKSGFPTRPTNVVVSARHAESEEDDHSSVEDLEMSRKASYQFATQIDDAIEGNYQQRAEIRENGAVYGKYSVDDGFFWRTVYYQDEGKGFTITKIEERPSHMKERTGDATVQTLQNGNMINYHITEKDIASKKKSSRNKLVSSVH